MQLSTRPLGLHLHASNRSACMQKRPVLPLDRCRTRVLPHHAPLCTPSGVPAGLRPNVSSPVICQASVNGTPRNTGPHEPILEPTEKVLKLWRKTNAVCFDVDCEWYLGNLGLNLCTASHAVPHSFAEHYRIVPWMLSVPFKHYLALILTVASEVQVPNYQGKTHPECLTLSVG
jgi:hypothetical protein